MMVEAPTLDPERETLFASARRAAEETTAALLADYRRTTANIAAMRDGLKLSFHHSASPADELARTLENVRAIRFATWPARPRLDVIDGGRKD